MLDKDQFFDTYRVKDEFENSGLSWDVLERIYDDYLERGDDLLKCRKSLEAFIMDNMRATYHSVSSRIKAPMHLIEKSYGREERSRTINMRASMKQTIVRSSTI